MTTELNPSEATNLALNTLVYQIRNIIQMPDAAAKLAIGGFETLLAANLTMIGDAANAQVDEFNGLIDELESRDRECDTLTKANGELSKAVAASQQQDSAQREQLESELYAAQHQLNGMQTKYQALEYTYRQLERQLVDLKAADAPGMKRRIKEKNELLELQRAAIGKHKQTEAKYRREILELGRRVKELLTAINEQDRELANRHTVITELECCRDAKIVWYKHLSKTYTGEDGQLWNVYLVDHGLKSNLPYLVNDLDWKLHAMKGDGSGCSVMLSQWMNPIYPSPFGAGVPDAMTQDIYEFMQEALTTTHPHLLPRTEWAKTVSIHECDLPNRLINLLEGAELDTLYKVMSNQGAALNKIKGLGEKLRDQLIYGLNIIVAQWDDQWREQHDQAVAGFKMETTGRH
ncbi:MAG: hypothetical protein ACRC8Q_12700 [Aeromonas sp.]